MVFVTAVVVILGVWLPAPLYHLVQQAAAIIGGAS
jgi:putative Mn2+ efflux pump MntP